MGCAHKELKRLKGSAATMSVYYNALGVNAISMLRTTFHNRPAVQLENDQIRLTVLVNGGHIAEILDKGTGVNPLWIPPWTDEASVDFGQNAETRLLDGIMGHNLCLDLFGPPSPAEAAAGVVAHAEGGILPYEFETAGDGLICRCVLPSSQLAFERVIRLEGNRAAIEETVENLSVFDRPIAWTQHVTIGPPFLERGVTRFRAPVTRSQGIGGSAPQPLEVYTDAPSSSGFTTHLLDPQAARAFFVATSPTLNLEFGYFWNRADFPWLGVWEENHHRMHSPWNGRTMTRGMEFGVSPFPESRREMIERGTLFDTPCYRWIGAKSQLSARYCAVIGQCFRPKNGS
jgi:hypothetical protein